MELNPDDILNLAVTVIGGLVMVLCAIVGWLVKRNVERTDNHDARLNTLERHSITREEFTGAMAAIRVQLDSMRESFGAQFRDGISGVYDRIDNLRQTGDGCG